MSGFKSILNTHKKAKEQTDEATPLPSPAPAEDAPAEVVAIPKRAQAKAAEPTKKRGRPRGKRSDSDYTQVTAYIRSDTHVGVQMLLLKDGKQKDFSDLVEELLAKWLKSRT